MLYIRKLRISNCSPELQKKEKSVSARLVPDKFHMSVWMPVSRCRPYLYSAWLVLTESMCFVLQSDAGPYAAAVLKQNVQSCLIQYGGIPERARSGAYIIPESNILLDNVVLKYSISIHLFFQPQRKNCLIFQKQLYIFVSDDKVFVYFSQKIFLSVIF